MTTQGIANRQQVSASAVERVVIEGDLAQLTPEQRVFYYKGVCESLGLNPLTKPFAYIKLNGRLVLYAQRDATDQIRKLHSVSVTITSREIVNGVYVVTAAAKLPDGRADESVGAVPIENLKGEALANAYMKAETKAKRRVTLSIIGLGWLDETETSSIPDAQPVTVDTETGEILDEPKQLPAQPPRSTQAHTGLSQAQRQKLFATARAHGVPEPQLKEYMEAAFSISSTSQLAPEQFDRLLAWVEEQNAPTEPTEGSQGTLEGNGGGE